MSNKTEITVFDTKVRVLRVDGIDYFCITDLARYKNPERPDVPIRSWMNTKREIDFLYEWEMKYNEDFKHTMDSVFKGFPLFLAEVHIKNSSSPAKWIAYTNAKGLIVKRGKYGGTFAQVTIALNFANYIHAKFYINLLEEYQILKQERMQQLGDPGDIKRQLTAGNYSLLVSSIFSKMDERLLMQPQPYKSRSPFQAEADMLNEIVFKITAKEWRAQNTDKPADKNMRDYASVLDLVVLNNLQFLDSMLLQWGCSMEERRTYLEEAYTFQYPILERSKTIQEMQKLAERVGALGDG